MLRKLSISTVIAAFALAGCVDGAPPDNSGGTPTPSGSLGIAGGQTSSSDDQTFDHENEVTDPFAVLQRIQQQGPPEVSTRMHSCQKLKYATVGNLLRQLGVNMAATGAT